MRERPLHPSTETPTADAALHEHMRSVREVIRAGKHDTMLYPACGADIVRAMIAHDVVEAIGVDEHAEVFLWAQADLRERFGETATVTEEPAVDGFLRKKIVFSTEGARRVLHAWIGDTTKIDVTQYFGQMDIYHVYLPMRSAPARLTQELYATVRKDGFFSLEESSLLGQAEAWEPATLYSLLGLRKLPITRKKPEHGSLAGYLLHKQEDVPPERVQLGLEIGGILFNKGFLPLAMFHSEGFKKALFISEGAPSLPEEVNVILQDLFETIRDITRTESSSSLPQEDVERLMTEIKEIARKQWQILQTECRTFFYEAITPLTKQVKRGDLTPQEARQVLRDYCMDTTASEGQQRCARVALSSEGAYFRAFVQMEDIGDLPAFL